MPASTIWALASTTPASTLSASSATTSGNWKPSATRSPWNPPPSRHPSTRLDPAPLRYAGCCRLPTHRGFSDQDQQVQVLVDEARAAAEPTLVFCGSKYAVMRTAAMLADLEFRDDWAGLAAACRQRGVGVLFRGAPDGAAAEQAFRAGHLRVLVATSAVAQGVNLPAKVVVIRDDQ